MGNIPCYTEWGVKWGLYLNQSDVRIEKKFSETFDNGHGVKTKDEMLMKLYMEVSKWMTFAPIHEEHILVYQPGKVGSSSLYRSLCERSQYTLHTHHLSPGYELDELKMLCEKWGGLKVISVVREPLARTISAMWENFDKVWRYSETPNFQEVQHVNFNNNFELEEFEWYNKEMKNVFGIDIYEYPFDKEKGYTIIEKPNLSILLMTLEKMDELEAVIGKFVNVDDFKLIRANEGNKKPYRFAYSDYKKKIRFTEKLLEKVYISNPYMQHFYTDQMIKMFMEKWRNKLEYRIPDEEKKFLIDYEE